MTELLPRVIAQTRELALELSAPEALDALAAIERQLPELLLLDEQLRVLREVGVVLDHLDHLCGRMAEGTRGG